MILEDRIIETIAIRLEEVTRGNCDCCPFWDYCKLGDNDCQQAVRRFFEDSEYR